MPNKYKEEAEQIISLVRKSKDNRKLVVAIQDILVDIEYECLEYLEAIEE